MVKCVKIILISSLALNAILIIGFIRFKSTTSESIFETGALNAQSKATSDRHILHELETGDPNRIAALKKYLWDSIEISNRETEEYRQAANK